MTTPFISIISPSGVQGYLESEPVRQDNSAAYPYGALPSVGAFHGEDSQQIELPVEGEALDLLHGLRVARRDRCGVVQHAAGQTVRGKVDITVHFGHGVHWAVAVGAGVGVGVGIGVGVAVDIGVGMAVGVGVGVAVGIGVGMTVGVEVGSAVGAGSVGVESLPQATSTADARAIAITRQSTFFTLDSFDQMIRFLSKLMRFRHSDSTMPV